MKIEKILSNTRKNTFWIRRVRIKDIDNSFIYEFELKMEALSFINRNKKEFKKYNEIYMYDDYKWDIYIIYHKEEDEDEDEIELKQMNNRIYTEHELDILDVIHTIINDDNFSNKTKRFFEKMKEDFKL